MTVLDDLPHLKPLGRDQGIDGWVPLFQYLRQSETGVFGRPLALLTLSLNSPIWPADTWAFKYTNLMMHCLVAVLVFVLARRICQTLGMQGTTLSAVAILGVALWSLHPLQVSTVLYIVQRMTILSALFVLAGLILYVRGRMTVHHNPRLGYLLMTSGICGGGALAVLCKENGALIVLYAVILEYALLRPFGIPVPPRWRAWSVTFLLLPILAAGFYLVFMFDGLAAGYQTRDFSMVERLMTQARVITDYIARILLPRVDGSGVLHDDYEISRSLFEPPSTLLCAAALITLVVTALLIRRRSLRMIQFAILWFFAGQSLESSFLPLELYFEHRNYLPSVGPIIAIAYYAAKAPAAIGRLVWVSVAIMIVILSGLTRLDSVTWGDPALAATVWSTENAGSVRAQQFAANFHASQGELAAAKQHLERALRENPRASGVRVQLLQFSCAPGGPPLPDIAQLTPHLRNGLLSTSASDAVARLHERYVDGKCNALTSAYLHRVIDALTSNPRFQASRRVVSNLYFVKGLLYSADLELSPAMEALNRAFANHARAEIAHIQAGLLASAGLYEDALEYVELARRADKEQSWPFAPFRTDEIDALAKSITEEASGVPPT